MNITMPNGFKTLDLSLKLIASAIEFNLKIKTYETKLQICHKSNKYLTAIVRKKY